MQLTQPKNWHTDCVSNWNVVFCYSLLEVRFLGSRNKVVQKLEQIAIERSARKSWSWFSSISTLAATVHQQHQGIISISASAATMLQQHQQRLHRVQIICVCADICAFSVLDNRHLADICAICQKCQFEVRKGWKALFLQLKPQEMHCKQADSAILKL